MDDGELLRALLERLEGRFSKSLGIELKGAPSGEVFKWFLASLLFGARIGEQIAVRTYREFEGQGVLSPERIVDTGWDGLVEILDTGGYVRYDFKTATKLLEVAQNLINHYAGDLNLLHAQAHGPQDLEKRVRGLARGIGPTTTNIFLRELRGVWEKADPQLQEWVILAASRLGLVSGRRPEGILSHLKVVWGDGLRGWVFADFEVALLRLGRHYCRREGCSVCPMGDFCQAG